MKASTGEGLSGKTAFSTHGSCLRSDTHQPVLLNQPIPPLWESVSSFREGITKPRLWSTSTFKEFPSGMCPAGCLTKAEFENKGVPETVVHSRIWNWRERGSGGVCVGGGTEGGGHHPVVLSTKFALSASVSLSSCPGCWPALHIPSILLPAKKKILFLVHNTGHSHMCWAAGGL